MGNFLWSLTVLSLEKERKKINESINKRNSDASGGKARSGSLCVFIIMSKEGKVFQERRGYFLKP